MMAVLFMGCTKEFREHREELRLLRPLYGKTYDSLILTKDATPVIFPADFQFKLKVGEPEKRRQSAGYFAMRYPPVTSSAWFDIFDLTKANSSYKIVTAGSYRVPDFFGPLFRYSTFQPALSSSDDGNIMTLTGRHKDTFYHYEFR